jgi:hypothetical protein
VSVLLLLAFVAVIASAWARGLRIECGCSGGGGEAADAAAAYPWEIGRDLGLVVLSGLIARWPHSRLAVDNLLLRPPTHPES